MPSGRFQALAPTINSPGQAETQLPTFLDHIRELRRRLFWVVAIVLVASSIAYSFLGTILDVLTYPLGDESLFYLTPGGGLSFSFMLCAYVGVLVAVPAIMYHLYRFLEPLMGNWRRSTLFYAGLSTALAITGVLFAYFVSLPAAIKFLTGFNVNHIQAMLTADSYLSFVITYLLGAALLFQIPLLLLIINTMTPLKPSKLMKLQKFVIVGAFILGAMISPTPDIMNQLFLAVPIIAMYQLGVVMVWAQNRWHARKQPVAGLPIVTNDRSQSIGQAAGGIPSALLDELRASTVQTGQRPLIEPVQTTPPVQPNAQQRPLRLRTFSDITPLYTPAAPRPTGVSRPLRPATRLMVPNRTIDGFSPYRRAGAAGTS